MLGEYAVPATINDEFTALPLYHWGVSLTPHLAVKLTTPLSHTAPPCTLLASGATGLGFTVIPTPAEASLVQFPIVHFTV